MNIGTTAKLNDGNKIPLLGFGTWELRNGEQAERAVLQAIEAGYRHIDTATLYGNEESVGSAIKKCGVSRDDIFVVTKLWNSDHDDPEAALRLSLRRLKTDYVDLYLMHYPVPQRDQSWKVFEHMKKEGLCKSIGVSNFTIRHLQELLKSSKSVPVINQVEFHPFLYQKELMDFCRDHLIQLEAYSPLSRGEKLNDGAVVEIGRKYDKSPAQVMIRWSIQKGNVVIPKSSHRERIIENSKVFDFQISDDDMKQLDGLNQNLRTVWDPTDAP